MGRRKKKRPRGAFLLAIFYIADNDDITIIELLHEKLRQFVAVSNPTIACNGGRAWANQAVIDGGHGSLLKGGAEAPPVDHTSISRSMVARFAWYSARSAATTAALAGAVTSFATCSASASGVGTGAFFALIAARTFALIFCAT